jgi:hypothetical protein
MELSKRTLRSFVLPTAAEQRRQLAQAAHERLLRELERNSKTPHVARVIALLELLREAEALRLQLYPHLRKFYPEHRFADPTLQRLHSDLIATLRGIDLNLKRYRWTPSVRSGMFDCLDVCFVWPQSKREQWENWAVFWLLGHAKGARTLPAPILRFRQCEQCHKWFYGLTDWARCCSTACRKKLNAHKPEFRQSRAAYMRKYRQEEKAREKRAKALARESRRGA